MSILSVDNISPIGSGTSVTVNNAATLVVNNVNVSGVSTFSDIVDVTGSNSTVRLGGGATRRLMYRSGDNDIVLEAASNFFYRQKISDTSHRWYTNGADEKLMITGAGLVGISSNTPTSPLEIHTTAGSPAWKFRINTSVSDGVGFYQRANGDFELVLRDASNNNNYISGNGGDLQFVTTGTEKLRILSDGKLLIGSSNQSNNARLGNELCIVGTEAYTGMSITNYPGTNASHAPLFDFNRSRGTSDQSMTSVAGGDKLGELIFRGSNGSGFQDAVTLRAYADSVSGSIVNGRFEIGTTNGSHSAKMIISREGYVTKPYTPMFLAGRTGGNYTATIGTFPFNVTRINVGNHYSTSTYKFTAPVAGVYYFFAQVYYNNGSGQYRVGFRKEPSGGSAFMLNTASHKMVDNDNSQNISIIESMAVGDTVRLFSDQNASIQCYYDINGTTYGAHTYFMGYLIG